MLHKLFFETKMTWKRVILFAVVTAIVTAVMLILPFTADTSLANIGVTFECWILFALIIIMNCEKPLEAGIKTFVFFLISQPLIYLLQVPFYFDGWAIFGYYPYWAFITVLTFPGAMIAWYVKKDNILSAVILSVATGLLAYQVIYFVRGFSYSFPKNLLSAIFCVALIVVLIFALLKKAKNRIIAAIITLAVFAGFGGLPLLSSGGRELPSYVMTLDEGSWEIVSTEGNIMSAEINDDNRLTVEAFAEGEGTLVIQSSSGEEKTYVETYSRKNGYIFNEQ